MKRLLQALTATAGLTTGAMYGLRKVKENRSLDFSRARPEELVFPAGFRFGAATAAHQVEGGTTNNQWTAWESVTRSDGRPGIFTGENAGLAADHWNRFDQDLELMQDLGIDTYRFSLEWSRIEPSEGVFDDEALDRYRSWCVKLRAAGIEPMVTLHHFTDPLWLTEKGGFENRASVDAFGRFVEHVVPRLADVVDWWVTVNEPSVYTLMGWVIGEFPPGKNDPKMAVRVMQNVLLAHARAYHLIHELDTVDADGDGIPCKAGIAKNLVPFEPRQWYNPLDALGTEILDRFYNLAPLEAIHTGRLKLSVPGQAHLDVVHPELKGTMDYIGLNHYFRQLVRVNPLNPKNALENGFDDVSMKSDMGWDLRPQSLYDALLMLKPYGVPIYITENGTADGDTPDARRRQFLLDCLYAAHQAIEDGIDLRGYLYWSLLDNFEWAHGFSARFGLYRVDYATQERTLTAGGGLFQQIIAQQ